MRTTLRIRSVAALTSFVVLGAYLRFFHIGQKSYWWDEIATVQICKSPLAQFWPWLWRFEANMSFYYLLVRLWIRHSDSEAWMRGFSAIIAVVSIPIIYMVGVRLAGKSVGLFAALLLCINAAHVAYAQEARSYALLILLCLFSLFFFLRMPDYGRVNAAAYILVSTLAVYSHFFAVFFLFAQWVSLGWLGEDRQRLRKSLLPVSLTAVLATPAVLYMLLRRSGQLAFVSPTQFKDLARLLYFLVADAGRFHKAIALLYLLCAGTAVYNLLRRWRRQPTARDWGTIVMISCTVLPILITFVLSFWIPMFAPRYLLICLPSLVLLAAEGIAEFRSTCWQVAVCILLIALSSFSLRWYYAKPKDDWRSLTAYLLRNAEAGDTVVACPPGAEWPVQFYQEKTTSGSKPQLSYLAPAQLTSELHAGGQPPPLSRFWIVDWGNSQVFKNLSQVIAPEYRSVDERHFPGLLTLDLYVASPTTQSR
jgi:uncharacterized membrane protein